MLRLFVSSPGDVAEERQRVDLVVERLNAEFESRVRIETIRWETSYYSAHETFQKQIPEAADCDVVVAVFRARLGTPLPDGFPRLPSGAPYPSGTAYEVLSAIEKRKSSQKLPDVYVFRYPGAPSVPLDAPDRAEIETQWTRLKGFFDDWFRTRSGEFIAAFQNYSSTDDFAAKVEDCLRQWLARRGFVTQGLVWDRLRGSPFPGLSAFEADRGRVFFGRDLAVAQAVERLRDAAADSKRLPFLLIIGASGSGKSSLLRAGLLPRLILPGTVPDVDLWRVAIVTPGPNPFLALAESLFADAALGPELRQGPFRTKEILAKQLAGDIDTAIAPLRDALDRAAEARKVQAGFDAVRPARLALAIDQAERLFVETDAATAASFAQLAAALVRQKLAYLVLVLRSDAYARFQGNEALVALREAGETFDLVPPTAAELEEIVTRPVAACQPRLAFEQQDGRSLAALLVTDAKGGDALPLLQMTLSRLYAAEARRNDGLLRFADYRGMDAAVTETANEALGTLDEAAQAELPALITGLVTDVAPDPLTGAPQPVVSALDRKTFEADNAARQALVEAFVDKRLLTAEGVGVFEWVRPVHEALLRIWPQAVAIVRENASLIRVRHTLAPIVREWASAAADAKPRHLELSPALLDGAQQLLRFGSDLSPAMRDFIGQAAAADAARRDRERQEQERRIRDAQQLAAANRRIARRTGVGLVAALALAAVAAWQWRIAQTETQVAQTQTQVAQTQTQRAEQSASDAEAQRNQAVAAGSRSLAALADLRINDGDAATGTLLALEAADQRATADVEAALINGRLHLREAAVLPTYRDEVHAAAFSADSRLVVTAAGNEAEIWQAATGTRVAVLSGHHGLINDARFSRDGTRVATASDDSTAVIWNVPSGKPVLVLKGHADGVKTIAFSPDGTQLVTASRDKTARIWDAKSGKVLATLSGHTAALTGAVFSPDGKLVLTTSEDATAAVWDAQTAKRVAQLSGASEEIWQGVFSADGKRVATASADGTAAVWDSATGNRVAMLKGHADRVFTIEFIAGSHRVVTASYDQTARIWDGDTGTTIAVLTGHEGPVMTARPSADGRFIVTASTDRTARVWDALTGSAIATLAAHTDWVMSAAFSPDGQQIVTAGRDRTARLWTHDGLTVETGQVVTRRRVWHAAISPDGSRVAAPSGGNAAAIWNAKTGALITVLTGHTADVHAVAFDPSGRRVVTVSDDRTAQVWDAATGRSLAVFSEHQSAVDAAAFSPDGKRVVTASADNTARIWNSETGQQLLVLAGHTGTISKVAFSPDGKRVVTVSPIDKTVRLWDAETGKPIEPGIFWTGETWGAAFSPDGQRLAVSGLTVTILDIAKDDIVATYSGFGERVMDIAYSPDGDYLLLASFDGIARVWNVANGRPVSVLSGFPGGLWSIAISADGRQLLTASGTQTLRIWPVAWKTGELVASLKPFVPRCLTPSERTVFNLPVVPPQWCFELDKWPYQSPAWKLWHAHSDDKDKPPQPGTPEWLAWVSKKGSDLIAQSPGEAVTYLEVAEDVDQERLENDPENPRFQLIMAANQIDLARALQALGKLDDSLADFRTSLDLVTALSHADPQNTDRQEDTAYLYEHIADVQLAQNSDADGVASYRQALIIRAKLAAAAPDNASRQGALAYVNEKLAEELLAEGSPAQALGNARDDVALRRELAAGQPANSDLQENLAYALRLLGDTLLAEGKAADATTDFRQSKAIRQKLADAEPANADRQSNLAFVDQHLADAVLADGNDAEALALSQQAVGIRQKLADAEPGDADQQSNLAYSVQRLAEALLANGKPDEAFAAYQQLLLIRQKLAASAPDNVERLQSVANANEHFGMALQAQGRSADAGARFRDAVAIRQEVATRVERDETAAKGGPGVATGEKLGSLAWTELFVRDFEKSLAASRRAADLAPDLIWIRVNLAHALMFLNRTDEARQVYLEFRGKKTFKDKIWEQSVLEDFSDLRKAGLTDPLMHEIEQTFAKDPVANSAPK